MVYGDVGSRKRLNYDLILAELDGGEAGIDPMAVDLRLGHSVKVVTSKILATYHPRVFQHGFMTGYYLMQEKLGIRKP